MSTVGRGHWSLDGGSLDGRSLDGRSLEEGRWCVGGIGIEVWVFTSSPFLLINLLPLGQYTGFGGLICMLGGFEQFWSFFIISTPIWDFSCLFTPLHLSVSDSGII